MRRFLTPLPAANRPARFQPAFYVRVRRPKQPAWRSGVCGSTCLQSPLILLFQLSRKATNRCPVQNLGAASLPNLNRMRHPGFHKSINSLLFITENRQFRKFIIITMILTSPYDSGIRWEEVLKVL
jgi:hypothetical protein